MKYIITFFIIPLLLATSTSQKEDFIGKWVGEDQGEIGYIIFDNEGYASFEIAGQIMGGKEFYMNGKKGKMTYTINTKTKPIEVDLTMTKTVSGETKKILGIAEFTSEDIMKFNISFDGKRPTQFDTNSINLKRVK